MHPNLCKWFQKDAFLSELLKSESNGYQGSTSLPIQSFSLLLLLPADDQLALHQRFKTT